MQRLSRRILWPAYSPQLPFAKEFSELSKRCVCTRRNIYNIDKETLSQMLESWKMPPYRTKQLWEWIYDRGVESFQEMSNLPLVLREKCESEFRFGDLSTKLELVSKKDGTVKRVYALPDRQLIESVLMPYETGRTTACISSQAGCGMNCSFCATGQMGFSRQLSSDEIFEQVLRFRNFSLSGDSSTSRPLTNVVFMGMGEPLANYHNVLQSVRRIMTELGIGARHITISTVGIPPRIRKLAHESVTGCDGDTSSLQVNLAVSLHCATNAKRSSIMPVNLRYPIEELMDACKYYVEVTNRRISFEWALIAGETDTYQSAIELGSLLADMKHLCHVNVIPLNPTDKFSGETSTKQSVQTFVEILREQFGIVATPRVRRGIDIDAGCGQLKSQVMKRLKSEKKS